ncbi:rod-binding protein [Crenalkalicoccus roseus]|uniref:rod-binding protein n=1 Tax=Crenalkalicoccus roseus TaxID=1485588 RepID=UPI001080BC96|nr:rod-binding protein [Crenalkalicoccus roseus]
MQALAPLPPAVPAAAAPPAMRRAAQEFEAQVLAQLLQPAFAAADISRTAFGGGAAEAQWRPMLVEAMAGAAARAGKGIGIAEAVLREMLRRQAAGAEGENGR